MDCICIVLLVVISLYESESKLYAVHINETTQRVAVRQILYDNDAKGKLSQWELYVGKNEPFFRYLGYSTMDVKRDIFISKTENAETLNVKENKLFVKFTFTYSRSVQACWVLFFCQHQEKLYFPNSSTLPL